MNTNLLCCSMVNASLNNSLSCLLLQNKLSQSLMAKKKHNILFPTILGVCRAVLLPFLCGLTHEGILLENQLSAGLSWDSWDLLPFFSMWFSSQPLSWKMISRHHPKRMKKAFLASSDPALKVICTFFWSKQAM